MSFNGASTDGPQVWFETTEATPRTSGADTRLDRYEITATGIRLLST